MPKPFNRYAYLKFSDVERCPFMWKDVGYYSWHIDDDRRMLLIALDRWADEQRPSNKASKTSQ